MSVHEPHPERDHANLPILFDGCARCDEQADELGLKLDDGKWRQAWQMMLRIEYHDEGFYLSKNDKKLGRSLYYMSLIIQRQGLDPKAMFAA